MKYFNRPMIIGALALMITGQMAFGPRESGAGTVLYKGDGYAVYWMKRLLNGFDRAPINPLEHASPIFQEGVVYTGTSEGRLYAISADSGMVIWEFQSDGSIESEPAIDQGIIFFGNTQGTFYALNADTGEQLWFYPTGGINFARPVFNGDNVIVFNNDDRLFSLNKLRGDVNWIKTIETDQDQNQNVFYDSSAPVIQGDKLFVGVSDGSMACISLQGELVWKKTITEGTDYRDIDAVPIISGNVLIIPSFEGFTYGLNLQNGDILWKIPGAGNTGGILSRDNSVCLPLTVNNENREEVLKIICLNPSNGEKTWESDDIKSVNPGQEYGWTPTYPIMLENKFIVGLSENGLVTINKDSGKIDGFLPLSSGISSNLVKGEGRDIFMLSNDGYFYKIHIL